MTYTLEVEPAQNELLAEMEKKTGRSNFARVMANRPKAMAAFMELYKAIMGTGSIDRRMKEMVYLAVSFVNECRYCGNHHMKSAKAAGFSDSEIHAIETENNQGFTEHEQIALHYARELTRTATVPDLILAKAQDLFSNDQLVELNMIVDLANFTNRFNNGLAVPVEH